MKAKKILITSIIGTMVTCGQVLASTYVPCGGADGDSNTNCWSCGATCTARLNNGKMTFSGTGDMYNYTAVNSGGVWQSNSPWNSHRNEILSVEIKDGITSVGEQSIRAFQNMTKLTIGNTVKKIGQGACYRCESLISVTIPASVENIEYEAFSRNNALENIEFETGSQLKNIGNVAFKETAISSINIPDSVESIGECAFCNIPSLQSIHLPALLKTLGDKVFEYSGLESVEIPEGVTYIPDRAFAYNYNLKNLTIAGDTIDFYYNALHYTGIDHVTSKESTKEAITEALRSAGITSFDWLEYIKKALSRDVKRIYTVEEATEAAKGNKNTFSIRYR